MDEITTVEKYVVVHKIRSRVARIAAGLRELAEEVEREARHLDQVGSPGVPTYGNVASRMQSRLMNMLPNLGLDALTADAAEADVARAKGE